MANDSRTKEHYSILKQRTLLVLKKIQGHDVQSQIDEIEDQLFSFSNPKKYDGAEGLEVKQIKGFNETCAIMNQYIAKDPKTMTVVEFYQTLDIIRDQLKAKTKAGKRKKVK